MSNGGEEVDFISKLPDDFLGHILSYLTTKQAVQTSVLSTRWRHLWTYINSLNFNDFPLLDNIGNHLFMDFVDGVLGHCKSQNIQKFALGFHGFQRETDLPRVLTWIHSAFSRNVKEIDLFLRLGVEDRNPVRLPDNFSSCKSLVELKLKNDFVFDIPSTIECFPSLKVLNVDASYPDCSFLSQLFSRCPVLEELYLYGDFERSYNVNNNDDDNNNNQVNHTITISSPTLKRLKIDLFAAEFGNISDYKFKIQTPNLENLNVDDDTLAHFEIDEIPFLHEAKVINDCSVFFFHGLVTDIEAHHTMELVTGIRNAKALTLSICTSAALVIGYAFHDYEFPIFPFLKRLELGIHRSLGWRYWPQFLTNSPVLESVILERESMQILIEEVEQFGGEFNFEDMSDWNPPQAVPYCLFQNLKEIMMRNLWGVAGEVNAVRFLLENGQVLEKMSINFDEESAFSRQVDRDIILNFPRASDNCVIEFV